MRCETNAVARSCRILTLLSRASVAQICRRIARAMHGDLTATSAGLGHGTTLTFVIPLCTPPADALDDEPDGAVDFAAPLLGEATRTLLLGGADDNAATSGGEAAAASCAAGIASASLAARDVGCPLGARTAAAAASMPRSVLPSAWPAAPASLAKPADAPIVRAASGTNILVAEDDALSQEVMRKVLGRLNVRFTMVGDGAAAVDAYNRGAPACCKR
jgi:CheY-like chemotaxis protein